MMSNILESTTCVGDVPLAWTMKKLLTMFENFDSSAFTSKQFFGHKRYYSVFQIANFYDVIVTSSQNFYVMCI